MEISTVRERVASSDDKVLVVEDEFLIAMMTESALQDIGFTDVVLARSLEKGLELARTGHFSFAILDVNLSGSLSFPIAEALRSRGIPFGFHTAYGREGLSERFGDCPVLTKPYDEDEFRAMVSSLHDRDEPC